MTSRIRRRVGYFVENNEGKLDISIHSVDFDETCYQELTDYSKVIFNVQPIVTAFEIVKNNYEEIDSSAASYKNSVENLKMPNPKAIVESLDSGVILTQRVSNLLSSASSFLTNAEISLEKDFGKSSNELAMWNNYRRNLHKESFSYRFMYELRNYAQHYGLPMSGFNISITDMLESSTSIDLTMYVSRDSLLKNNFNWKKLRKEIEELEVNSDIIQYLNGYFEVIRKLLVKYLDIYGTKLLECYEYISTFHTVFKIPEGVSPMLFIGEGSKEHPIPKNVEYIPTDQFMWVRNKYIALKNKA